MIVLGCVSQVVARLPWPLRQEPRHQDVELMSLLATDFLSQNHKVRLNGSKYIHPTVSYDLAKPWDFHGPTTAQTLCRLSLRMERLCDIPGIAAVLEVIDSQYLYAVIYTEIGSTSEAELSQTCTSVDSD